MNLAGSEVDRWLEKFDANDPAVSQANVIICPSFVFLEKLAHHAKGTGLAVGAQDMYWEDKGAYTGEVSGKQLIDIGCQFVIVGHSERRKLFGETDDVVNAKALAALKYRLRPIVCFGENYKEKEEGQTKKVIVDKVRENFKDIRSTDARKVVIAYEPLWAISTSTEVEEPIADSPESAQVVHKLIRKTVAELYDDSVAKEIRITYGGSVDSSNVASFAAMDDIDGVLVGGASKEASSFQSVVSEFVEKN